MFRLLIGAVVLLVLGLASSTTSHVAATVHAEGSAEDVQDINLAKMTLPLSAFGPEYAAFQRDEDTGFSSEEDQEAGESSSYFLSFSNPDEDAGGVVEVGTGSLLLEEGVNVETFLSDIQAVFESEAVKAGATFETFPVLGFDHALGLEETFELVEFKVFVKFTFVIFGADGLVGAAAVIRVDDETARSQVTTIASTLQERMKGVLTGNITELPAALPPDVNCDGEIDAVDASLLLQLGADLVESLPCGLLGDANDDGRVDAVDASLILQYSAGLIDSLPVS